MQVNGAFICFRGFVRFSGGMDICFTELPKREQSDTVYTKVSEAFICFNGFLRYFLGMGHLALSYTVFLWFYTGGGQSARGL